MKEGKGQRRNSEELESNMDVDEVEAFQKISILGMELGTCISTTQIFGALSEQKQ